MIQIDLQALPDLPSFASPPRSLLHAFLDLLRRVFPLVLLHPARAGSDRSRPSPTVSSSPPWFAPDYDCGVSYIVEWSAPSVIVFPKIGSYKATIRRAA